MSGQLGACAAANTLGSTWASLSPEEERIDALVRTAQDVLFMVSQASKQVDKQLPQQMNDLHHRFDSEWGAIREDAARLDAISSEARAKPSASPGNVADSIEQRNSKLIAQRNELRMILGQRNQAIKLHIDELRDFLSLRQDK